MRKTTILLVALALALIPAAAAGTLAVDVTQADDGTAAVNVTGNESDVANATVSVEATDENATYDGTGEYTTNENGSVELPAPDETVNVTVTATTENGIATTDATLHAADEIDDGSDTNETTENETADNETVENFGQELQRFKLSIDESDPDKGLLVAEYATSNNPGNAPDHAGPKKIDYFLNETSERGPPEHAGNGHDTEKDKGKNKGNSGNGGPPAHAGNDKEDSEDEDE